MSPDKWEDYKKVAEIQSAAPKAGGDEKKKPEEKEKKGEGKKPEEKKPEEKKPEAAPERERGDRRRGDEEKEEKAKAGPGWSAVPLYIVLGVLAFIVGIGGGWYGWHKGETSVHEEPVEEAVEEEPEEVEEAKPELNIPNELDLALSKTSPSHFTRTLVRSEVAMAPPPLNLASQRQITVQPEAARDLERPLFLRPPDNRISVARFDPAEAPMLQAGGLNRSEALCRDSMAPPTELPAEPWQPTGATPELRGADESLILVPDTSLLGSLQQTQGTPPIRRNLIRWPSLRYSQSR